MLAHQQYPTPLPCREMSLFALDLTPTIEFQLSDMFLEGYAEREPAWGPVGYVTYKRTYSRFQDPEKGGAFRLTPQGQSEEWWQTVARVVEGTYQIMQRHCAYNGVSWEPAKAQRSAQEMYDRIWSFKFTPPGRGLWMMGTPFIRTHGSAALNNCAFVSTKNLDVDFSEPFVFLMDLSMLGVGVGSDTRGVGKVTLRGPSIAIDRDVFEIPDSREGWISATKIVLESYAYGRALPIFDYSHIRLEGALIRGFGGIAAGPEPLRQLLEDDIPSILDKVIGRPITSTAIVDLFNAIGRCVVSGNVRRSAEIMFGRPDDESFLDLKNREVAGPELDAWRWNSNNSLFAEVGMDYSDSASRTATNGEPGYLWLDVIRAYGRLKDAPTYADAKVEGANPCVEQSLEHLELCCLVETYPAHHEDLADFLRTLKFAYLYAKTVTLLPTHLPKTNAVMMRNRRIGCSQSGIVQNFNKVGYREHMRWCEAGYQEIQRRDEQYSDWLGVPRSRKTTSVKPSGTVSKLCGATAGIHYPFREYYIQRITFHKDHALVRELRRAGYPMEPYLTDPARTVVVEFPIHEKHFQKGERDVTLWEQAENAAQMQSEWADNQVSCTIKFDPEIEGRDIQELLERYEGRLKGISFLPHENHGYKQAPWEEISKAEYEQRVQNIRPLRSVVGDTADQPERFCDGDACSLA